MANHALWVAKSNIMVNPVCWKLQMAQRNHSKRYKLALDKAWDRQTTTVDRNYYRAVEKVRARMTPLRRI